MWDAATGEQIGQSLKHDAAVKSAIFSHNGNRVVTASADKNSEECGMLRLANRSARTLRHDGAVKDAAFSAPMAVEW